MDQASSSGRHWQLLVGTGQWKGTYNVRWGASNNLQQALCGRRWVIDGGQQAMAQRKQWAVSSEQQTVSGKQRAASGWRRGVAGHRYFGLSIAWQWDSIIAVVLWGRLRQQGFWHLCWCVGCGGRHCRWDSNTTDKQGYKVSYKIWFRQGNVYLRMKWDVTHWTIRCGRRLCRWDCNKTVASYRRKDLKCVVRHLSSVVHTYWVPT